MKSKKIKIAIDGPVGSGKSTVAKLVAQRLGYIYIDTGAMYRAVALKIQNSNLKIQSFKDIEKYKDRIVNIVRKTNIELKRGGRVFLDGKEVTEEIRRPEISNLASPISTILQIREFLTNEQKSIAKSGGVVMEGRDIGTVVIPSAEVKIFLTASLSERAKRRYLELKAKGFKVDLKRLKEEIKARDEQDTKRKIAPLKRAEDAILINTDGKGIEKVVEEIMNVIQNRKTLSKKYSQDILSPKKDSRIIKLNRRCYLGKDL